MGINEIIMYIMMFFMLIAAVDRILSQFGARRAFSANWGKALRDPAVSLKKGLWRWGALGLAMVGMTALAPVLAHLLGPVIIPLYEMLGANPSMFAGTLLACDMGGFFLAKELAGGRRGGLDVLRPDPRLYDGSDHCVLHSGGARHYRTNRSPLAGARRAGGHCHHSHRLYRRRSGGDVFRGGDQRPAGRVYLALILMNMIPVIIVAVLVALGLKFIPEKMINGFQIFAKFLVALITIGLAAAVIKFLLGWELIPGLDPIFMAPGDQPGEVMRAIEVIGSISCVLLGAYPMVLLLTRWFEKPLMRVGNLLKINNMAAGGMVATLANNIPMFGMMKQMDTRGKVINCAFSVSAAANMNAMIFPMIVGKLVGGVTAIGVAMLLVPKDENVPAPANNEAEAHS
ncbi:ethanolamine permease [Klebsiella pneumoniae]|uniref:Ethanolamine permease n=1 Tax=Klebsiella pneumoniae TaxID=573 RepID=A0A377XGG3_KLEPN|nr:ethanolamine permease [Klebsiella pneumoniae]